ncbi:hypothetical protein D9756_009365 [Leucocoprinus leucothites]|uniref:Uncharacterized protein n=1 Tax=Leucocoprinus leucothites TaxID=201217 RepID=A0A8H5CWH9_9AGAR|nr:hypothetical protein D9756_009365 [Leucoagaricus leucothites]
MDTLLHDDSECMSIAEDDTQSFMDEDDVREVRLHHWLSETASAQLMQDSALTRADSPLLGFDHLAMQGRDVDSANKPLPELPMPVPRLRTQSTASSTIALNTASHSVLVAVPAVPFQHRRSPSQNSIHTPSPSLSRRPSLARKPSLPLLSESVPCPSVQESTRLHSITSSLSIGSNRNAVYIDSEEVSSRLDEWLTTGNPEMEYPDDDVQSINDYYATNFDRQDSSAVIPTPSYTQGPPPNTPMTAYYKTPQASSSQIYLGKSSSPSTHIAEEAVPSLNTTTALDQEDIRATPVPHGKLTGPDLAISCSTPSSESSHGSQLFSAATLSTSLTSAGISMTSIVATESSPRELSSKPSLASLPMGKLSSKLSASSIGLAYQTDATNSNMLSPPAATASRWSLSSSVAGDTDKDRKKERGGKRKRLVSFISKLAGHSANKEIKETFEAPVPYTRGRSFSDASFHENALLPPVKLRSKSKPPSLKLEVFPNPEPTSTLRSPTLSSKPSFTSLVAPLSPSKSSTTASTPTPTIPASLVGSPVSASFTPISPIKNSFTSTRLSVSTSMTTTSTNTASPLMPTTPILSDAPLSPTLKNAVSVPALSPAYEGPGLIRRDNSYGTNMSNGYFGEHASPPTPSKLHDEDDDRDIVDDAEFYTREFSIAQKSDPVEEERLARLSLITDMLDRELSTAAPSQPKDETAPNPVPVPPPRRDSLFYQPKGTVKIDVAALTSGTPSHSSRTSPVHFRKSSSMSRTSSVQRRSLSSSHPMSPTVSTPPPIPSKGGFRSFAARMGISNSLSTPQSPPSPETESKRKSLANLMSNGKRKGSKRRLVISGVGDGQGEVAALKEWCASLGEVRSMVKVKSVDGVVTEIGRGDRSGQNVWVVDFKKSSVAESVCRLQAKVEIKGAGSVRLSWETAKPKLSFNVGKMGWMP